jgi:hypothetical protein
VRELESRLRELQIRPMNADAHTPIPESELSLLEEEIDSQLPDDYRWFLRRYGRSLFENAVSCPSSLVHGAIPFAFFYGANSSGEGVLQNYTFYQEQFPKGLVPIGEASLGDLYLLAGTGPNRGKVYYWCHDAVTPEDDEEETISGEAVSGAVNYRSPEQVASSFTAFVLGLQLVED